MIAKVRFAKQRRSRSLNPVDQPDHQLVDTIDGDSYA
jgi:hypothetical protein